MDWFLYDNGLRHEKVNLQHVLGIPVGKYQYEVKNKEPNTTSM